MSQNNAQEKIRTVKISTFDPKQYAFWVTATQLTFGRHNLFNIVEGLEPNPFPDDNEPFENLNPQQRRTVRDWHIRHDKAHEALIYAIENTPAQGVAFGSRSAMEIWQRLREAFGFRSVMSAASAEGALNVFRKTPNSTMREHITKWEDLLQQYEYHRLPNDPPKSSASKNVTIMNSIILTNNPDTDKWKNWFNSMQNDLETIPTATLVARLNAFDDSERQQQQINAIIAPPEPTANPPVQANTLQDRITDNNRGNGRGRGRGGYRGSYRGRGGYRGGYSNRGGRGNGRGNNRGSNRGNRGWRRGGNRGNENGERRNSGKCSYCGLNGHTDENCGRKLWYTQQRPQSKETGNDPWTYRNEVNVVKDGVTIQERMRSSCHSNLVSKITRSSIPQGLYQASVDANAERKASDQLSSQTHKGTDLC